MIPFYIYYSMFGFQRTADSIWAYADQLGRGFLIGATAGRTTLTGEGLQHADGHSPLIAATNPACVHYDPAFAYEISHIVQNGLQRMYGSTDEHPHGEDVFYYLTVYNEPTVQLAEPENVDAEGILKGMHMAQPAETGEGDHRPQIQLLASGVAVPWALKAQRLLAEEWHVRADVWSVTSWNELTREALRADEWNLLHPDQEPRAPYVTTTLDATHGPVLAVSDYMRAVPDQISQWVRSDWHSLGTDGFGFADTRAAARRFFRVDAESIVVAALEALAERGAVDLSTAVDALAKYRIDDPTAVAGVKQEGAGA
ncbi:MAG: pyruvate dehydrogenase (acetyl-transferring), homodimeric type, partial [Nocardioidaceae bacterium]